MTFFKLIRYPNLIMLAITLLLVRTQILGFQCLISLNLSDLNFTLFAIGILFIAAGGYIINDIFDQTADRINKPDRVFIGNYITEKKAWQLYILMSAIGIILTVYVSISLESMFNIILCSTATLLLYLYSKFFQKLALIGNLIISLLIPCSIVSLYFFEYTIDGFSEGLAIFYWLLPYLFFAFISNLMREILKDIEDIDGDYNQGFKTLPILIGKVRSRNFVLFLTAILLVSLLLIVRLIIMYEFSQILLLSVILVVILPLLFWFYHLWSAKSKQDFHKSSHYLKLIMVSGILTILLIRF